MDSASRLLIQQNEQLIKRLDINILKPYLEKSKLFTSSMLRDIFDPSSDSDLFSELPSRGPHALSRFLDVLDEAGYKTEANNLMNGNDPKYEESEVESVFYPMKSQPLGYCLIINNINFYVNDKEIIEKRREGSLVDAQRLRDFFEKLGYLVEEQINLTCNEMKTNMKNLAKSDVLKIVGSCFIIVLSHGDYNVIHDIYFSELKQQEVYDIFNNVNCKNLRKKPKIILFQACRGKNRDDGIFSDENSDSSSLSEPNTGLSPERPDVSSIIHKYPTLSDMIVIHASLPDNVCYLDKYDGSWLVQDLLSVIMNYYLVQDLVSMLTIVSRKLQERLSLKGHKKQVLHVELFGVKALFHICNDEEYIGPNKKSINYLS